MINLQLLRIQAKLTQTALALRANVARGNISFIELGRLNPTPDELTGLARALGVAVADAKRLLEHVPAPTWAELPAGAFEREQAERDELRAQGIRA